MKSAFPPAPALPSRPLRASGNMRARDWRVVLALCMGVGGLLLMFVLFWL